MTSPITLVQLTDTHLVPMSMSRLRGFPTQDSLAAVLTAIQAHKPDYLLLTGDLADAGDWEAYQQLAAMITPLGIPSLWLPGNHDLCDRLAQTLNQPPFDARKSLTIGQWRLILLDSVITTNCVGTGQLSASTLTWLHQELQTYPTYPTLIALHHHPLPTQIGWLDQISLLEPDTFLAMLDSFPQVRLVVFGHIHQAFHQQCRHIHYYGCPSTCTQVAPAGLTDIAPELMQPGFRWLRLYADGTHETGVERVPFVAPVPT